MTASYPIPATTVVVETDVKKSRFITYLAHAPSRADALTFIQSIRHRYPDANHHCSAFIAGSPTGATAIAFDDDGEPGGTAGKPMLNVLMHKGIGEIVTVVVRYFGGIRLGAGGLVRAYSSAVQAACEQLPLTERVALLEGSLVFEYSQEQMVRHHLEQLQIKLLDCHYGEQVVMSIAAPASARIKFSEILSEVSRGQIQIDWLN